MAISTTFFYQIIFVKATICYFHHNCFCISFLSSSGTHRLKVIRDIFQHAWAFLNSFFTHVLCFIAFRDPSKCFRHFMHYLVAHLLGYILISDKCQPWFVAHSLIAHFLCFEMVRNVPPIKLVLF